MSCSFEHRVERFIRDRLAALHGRVLLAVSGGVDSMVMLHVLVRLVRAGRLPIEPVVGHVNHHLRPEADAEEAFVRDTAGAYAVETLCRGVDVGAHVAETGLSVETAARQLRGDALLQMAQQAGCAVIATAHHADDNIETVLFRLRRGTGYRGLAGIRPQTVRRAGAEAFTVVRPLLCAHREDIESYARKHGLRWCEDPTNRQRRFARNRIRHDLLPYLTRLYGAALPNKIERLSQVAGDLLERVEDRADAAWRRALRGEPPHAVDLSRDLVRRCPPILQVELIRRAIVHLGLGERALTNRHYEALMQLIGQTGRGRMDLPGGGVLRCCEHTAHFTRIPEPPHGPVPPRPTVLTLNGTTDFGPWHIEVTERTADLDAFERFRRTKDRFVEWIDAARVRGPLRIRARQVGDRFQPIGMPGEKRVGKFLCRRDVPPALRREVCIIEDEEGIIWVAPVRLDRRCRVTKSTTHVVKLGLSRLTRQDPAALSRPGFEATPG